MPRILELLQRHTHLSNLTKPNGSSTIDFQNDASQRRLTEALLHRDFGLSLSLPNDRLCPPIPNRLNYVLWIQDIIRITGSQDAVCVRGIDIGTGASAIYPLLACKMEPGWTFTATDIDEASIRNAQTNVESNDLQHQITIMAATPDGPILLPLSLDPSSTFDFTMCNPPFYSSAEDVVKSAEAKELRPSGICTGAEVEMITPGGESAFVCRMVCESLVHGTRCQWYTSMIGKMSSLYDVVALLRQYSVQNYAITEFIQGQTRRWAIAWSFTDIHLPDDIARTSSHALRDIMPSHNTVRQLFPPAASTRQLGSILEIVLKSIDGVSYELLGNQSPNPSFVVHATTNTWSRTARRKKMHSSPPTLSSSPIPVNDVAVKYSITVKEDIETGHQLEFEWMQGRDRGMYESFCSHISRKAALELENGGI